MVVFGDELGAFLLDGSTGDPGLADHGEDANNGFRVVLVEAARLICFVNINKSVEEFQVYLPWWRV